MGKQEACSREKKRITAIGIRLIFFSQEQVLVRKERSAIYQKWKDYICMHVGLSSFFGPGSMGPMDLENYQHFGEIGKNCIPFK